MKKIIVLSGSFNPVTRAHSKILSDAVEKYGADEGLFVMTNDKYLAKKNLLKVKMPSSFALSEKVRAEMLNSLRAENPKLSCWGVELGGVSSSTYKTLVRVLKDKQKQYSGEEVKLYFLFGADKMKSIPHWQNAEEMINLCEYLVYSRNFDFTSVMKADRFFTTYSSRIHFMEMNDDNLEDVSSTEVRRRFFAGEDYSSLMNKGPYEIMSKLKPDDFPPVTREDLIKANILYGGQFGRNAARLQVYKSNCEIFKAWKLPFLGDVAAHRSAKVYDSEFFAAAEEQDEQTSTDCVNADCVDVAEGLSKEGFHPVILNLASGISPCGGYHKGFKAQEESLAQRSTLSQSLYQFGNTRYKYIRDSGLVNVPGVYPLNMNYGGIYSPCVTFFRNSEEKYFSLRDLAFDCPIISVASLSNREKNDYSDDERKYFDENGSLTVEGKSIETNKIRTIFRIALDNGHDCVVSGAFGCGVYRMHCNEVASLFHKVLEEPEFKNKFKRIVFAIYEGKPSSRKGPIGREGKYSSFYEEFGKRMAGK